MGSSVALRMGGACSVVVSVLVDCLQSGEGGGVCGQCTECVVAITPRVLVWNGRAVFCLVWQSRSRMGRW